MAIVGKITNQGFVGNLQGNATSATNYQNSGSIDVKFKSIESAVGDRVTKDTFNTYTSSIKPAIDKVTSASSSWDGAAASASSEASLTFNPGTGLKINLTASFAGKTASAAFDAAHSHDDKLDVSAFNTYTSSADSTFAGTAANATLAASASHAAEIQWSGITGKPTATVANIDAAAAFVAASASALNKTAQDKWDAKQDAIANQNFPATASKYISAIQQTNGAVTASFADLPLVAEYTITKDTSSGDYAAVYHLTKDGTAVGEAINIPKDMVIKAAAVITYNGTDAKITIGGVQYTVEGTHAAGKYVVMIVNNAAAGASQIWIDVKDLVDVYTAGNGISISAANVVSAVAKSGDAYIEVTANGIASKGIDAAINAASQSVKSYADTSSENAALRAIASASADLNTYKSSNDARVSALETASGSAKDRLDAIEAASGSWKNAASWVGSNSGSLATAASMTQSGYQLTANFRGQTASVNIASASYAAKADDAIHAVDATKVVSGSVSITVVDGEIVFTV